MSCAACEEKRRHTPAETREFHPLAGHGYAAGVGWTLPELETANERANERAAAADRCSARSFAASEGASTILGR